MLLIGLLTARCMTSVVSVLLRLFVWDVTIRVDEISLEGFFEFLVLNCQDTWQTIWWSCGTCRSQDFNKRILWFYLWMLISYKHLLGSSIAALIHWGALQVFCTRGASIVIKQQAARKSGIWNTRANYKVQLCRSLGLIVIHRILYMEKPGFSVLNHAQGKWNLWLATHHFLQFTVPVLGKIKQNIKITLSSPSPLSSFKTLLSY